MGLVLWMVIGVDVYGWYGVKERKVEDKVKGGKGVRILNMRGMGVCVV